MAMQIEFKDDYKEVSTYNGIINDKYEFTVDVFWDSIERKYIIKDIDFITDTGVTFNKRKAVKRIKMLVKGWYYIDEK